MIMPGILRILKILDISSHNLLKNFLVSVIGYFLILYKLSQPSPSAVIGLILSFLGVFLFFYGFWLLDKAGWQGGWGPEGWEERHSAHLA